MGLRKDLDSVKKRYVYHLLNEKKQVIYVGTCIDPKQRYKSHLKRSETGTAPLYVHIRDNSTKFTIRIVLEVTCTYADAEKYEIAEIEKHQETCLNFYNNPRAKKINKK